MSESWSETSETESFGVTEKEAGNEIDIEMSVQCQHLQRENELLKERHDFTLNEYRHLRSFESEEQLCDRLSSMPDNAMQITLSYLSINELFTLRYVSRRLKNWAEFEMKSRNHIFIVTRKHTNDYQIFLHFKRFPNIKILVIDSLSPAIQLHNLLRLCKDFLTELQHIVVEGYEEYMAIISVYPKTEKCVSSSEMAQQLLSKVNELSANDKYSASAKFTSVYYLHGLKIANSGQLFDQQRLSEKNESYRKCNTFLRDKIEFFERECQRIKNEENFSLFTMLPEEVTLKILEFLDTDDYFNLRLVSKELKYWAEMALKSRKQTLYVNLSTDSAYRIYLWSKVYSNIKTLTVSGSDLSLELFLRVSGDNFPFLENLTICSCDAHNIELIGDYFTSLKSLTLRYNDAVGAGIPNMLSKLCELESLTVNGSLNPEIVSSNSKLLCFNGNATHLQTFTYECFEYSPIDLKLVSETLKTELPNLKALHLNLPSKSVHNFCELYLSNVEELELCCCRIEGSLTLLNEANSVKKLILNTELNNDVEIHAVLRNFTHLNTLQLDLFRNHEISFSLQILEALRSLTSLKFFFLFDAFYAKSRYLTLDDGNKSALIEVLSSLNNISKFKIEFAQQSYEDEDLVTAVNELTAKKPQQSFELIIPDNEFDVYESFSEASINTWDSYVGSCSDFYDSDEFYD